jgi:hypothetical protein
MTYSAPTGLMFILIIWLQGIWLPRHGYSFEFTRYGRAFTCCLSRSDFSSWDQCRAGCPTGSGRARSPPAAWSSLRQFVWLALIPVNFSYWEFAAVLLLNGIGTGLFAAPNRADIMNSLPPNRRGVGAGMSTTFQNAAMVLSIGIFFSLMISGLARSLPHTLADGLIAQGVPAADATRVAALPPVSVLFASLLGYNPVQTCSSSAC